MLLKLPIISDNKVVFTLFKLIKQNTYYILSLVDNINNDDINVPSDISPYFLCPLKKILICHTDQ